MTYVICPRSCASWSIRVFFAFNRQMRGKTGALQCFLKSYRISLLKLHDLWMKALHALLELIIISLLVLLFYILSK